MHWDGEVRVVGYAVLVWWPAIALGPWDEGPVARPCILKESRYRCVATQVSSSNPLRWEAHWTKHAGSQMPKLANKTWPLEMGHNRRRIEKQPDELGEERVLLLKLKTLQLF